MAEHALLTNKQLNLSRWMNEIFSSIRKKPLSNITIPGSHDACAYNLSTTEIAPFAPAALNSCLVRNCCGCVSQNFALAQSDNLFEQMQSGSRYLDIRVTFDEKRNLLRTEHSLYGLPIRQLLQQVALFIELAPSEFVILHLRHFSVTKHYDMNSTHHKQILDLLQETFSNNELFMKRDELHLPFEVLKERGRCLQIIYGISSEEQANTLDWIHLEMNVLPDGAGWSNSQSVEDLQEKLEIVINNHQGKEDIMYKITGALTPDDTVVKDGILNCILCCLCRCICTTKCFKPASLREISDVTGAHLMKTVFKNVKEKGNRINIIDMDHISRQQSKRKLMESVVLLNVDEDEESNNH